MSINNSAFPIQLLIMFPAQIEFKILIDRSGNKTYPLGIFLFLSCMLSEAYEGHERHCPFYSSHLLPRKRTVSSGEKEKG